MAHIINTINIIKLICDTRERNVVDRHSTEFAAIAHEIRQLTTADYAIERIDSNGAVQFISIIERKSLEDFAASIKDGRYDNKDKMIEFRRKTGAKCIILIEGNHITDPNKLIGKTPYYYIESAIFHMTTRDDFVILWSQDTLNTAQILVRYVKSMATLFAKHPEVEDKFQGGVVDNPAANIAEITQEDANKLLTAQVVTNPQNVLRAMWATFKGISVTSADEYAKHFTLAEIVSGTISKNALESIKLASGKKASKGVIAALASAGTAPDAEFEARLLAEIPGISRATAREITGAHHLKSLLSYEDDAIAIITIGKARRKLGLEKAKKIREYLTMKITPS